jgi:uncharacterized protein
MFSARSLPAIRSLLFVVIVSSLVLTPSTSCGRRGGTNSLHKAIEKGNVREVQRLITDKAALVELRPVRVGAYHTYDMTPLQAAAFWGQDEVIGTLLAAGAAVDHPDSLGVTALHVACGRLQIISRREAVAPGPRVEYGTLPELSTVRSLLAARASPDARDQFGITPLMDAAAKAPPEVVKALLDAGADVNAKSLNATTVLNQALNNWDVAVIDLVIQRGARLEDRSEVGATALMLAAYLGREEDVDRLLRAGADATAVDNAGMTAADYASGRAYPLKTGGAESRQGIIEKITKAREGRPR